jgi:hypothetical protein
MTTKPLLLGLVAPAGGGKTTVASYLESEYAFAPIAFAEPILDMLCTLAQHADVDGAWCADPGLKEQTMPVIGHSYRELAQTLGTEWGRSLDPNLWIKIADSKLDQALVRGDNVVITDVRFENEMDWLHRRGGTMVRITRDGVNDIRPHVSEHGWRYIACEHELNNNGSKATLFDQVDRLMAGLRMQVPA